MALILLRDHSHLFGFDLVLISPRTVSMNADTAPCVPASCNSRPLGMRDAQILSDHLLALCEHDRYFRFCGVASDVSITRLIQESFHKDANAFIGCFEGVRLVGVAQLAPSQIVRQHREIAFSVAPSWRRRGIASRLLVETIARAREDQSAGLSMFVLPDNVAMLSMARKFGFRFQSSQNLVEVSLAITGAATVGLDFPLEA